MVIVKSFDKYQHLSNLHILGIIFLNFFIFFFMIEIQAYFI